MTKLRGVGLTLLLVGVICALVPILGLAGPDQVTVSGSPNTAAQPSPVSMHRPQAPAPQTAKTPAQPKPDQVDPGPLIDPGDSERANAEKTQNKLIVAGITVFLLAVVVWGRRIRSQRRKKAKS